MSTSFCQNYPNYYVNLGLTNYRHGEEVLNSSSSTQTWLAKTTLRPTNDHILELGYLGFRSEHGEVRSSDIGDTINQPIQRWLSTASTDTVTARYRWKPTGNDLIDVKWNAWFTALEALYPTTASSGALAAIGRPASNVARTLIGTQSHMWGSDLSNTSRFSGGWGHVSWSYGLSYLHEATAPTRRTQILESFKPREGEREEYAAFSKAEWTPLNWLMFDAGIRYQYFNTIDQGTNTSTIGGIPGQTKERSGYGVSPNIGITVTPLDWLQLFGRYSEGVRSPSLIESTGAYALYVDPDIRPERSHTWEFGFNVLRNNALATGDRARLKVSYFDTDVRDYISRIALPYDMPIMYYLSAQNIHAAKFAGVEVSSRYERNGLSLEIAGNYYTNVEFCLTASTCTDQSLPADYAANHIPPRYTASLTVSQKLLDDALTVGGRLSHIGPRSAKLGPNIRGAATLVAPVVWDAYTLLDVFAEYKISERLTFEASVENLTDIYYVNPLSNGHMPAPGRTLRASMTMRF